MDKAVVALPRGHGIYLFDHFGHVSGRARDRKQRRRLLGSLDKERKVIYHNQRTEELARQIALTPTDLIMLTKRSINRQFEVMGFRTGIAASVDLLALSSFRERGIYARRSRDGSKGEAGDEFLARSQRDGLKAALEWREQTFGNRYRSGDGRGPDEEAD